MNKTYYIIFLLNIIWARYPYDSILQLIDKETNLYKCNAIIIAEKFIVLPKACIKDGSMSNYKVSNLKYGEIKTLAYLIIKKELILVKSQNKFEIGDIIAFDTKLFDGDIVSDTLDPSLRKPEIFSFKWVVRNNKYSLFGLLKTNGLYDYTFNYSDNLFNDILESLNTDDGESNIPGTSFVNIPLLKTSRVLEFTKDLINDKWIKTESGKKPIPFKSDQVIVGCCGIKYDLVKIYNRLKYKDIHLSAIMLYCKSNIDCMNILGHDHYDHICNVYRDFDTKKLMLIDPAVKDVPFELNSDGIKLYLKQHYNVDQISYFIVQPNWSDFANDEYSSIYYHPLLYEYENDESDYDTRYRKIVAATLKRLMGS